MRVRVVPDTDLTSASSHVPVRVEWPATMRISSREPALKPPALATLTLAAPAEADAARVVEKGLRVVPLVTVRLPALPSPTVKSMPSQSWSMQSPHRSGAPG